MTILGSACALIFVITILWAEITVKSETRWWFMVIIFPVRGAVFAGILYLLSVHIDLNRLSDQINGRVFWEQRLENVIKSIWKMQMENYLKSLVCSWVHCFCQWLLTLIWFLHITASGKTLNPWSHPVRTCFAESEYWTIICPSQEASCDPWKDKFWNMKIVLHIMSD